MQKFLSKIWIIGVLVVVFAGGFFAWQKIEKSKEIAKEPLIDWAGTYEYSEFAPPNQTWVYGLDIYKEGSQLKARLDIDGFQTLFRIQAIAKEHNKNLDIVFDSYRPGNSYTRYQQGDLLFSLKKISEENYKIIWNKLQSNLLKPGIAEFKKAINETANWKTYTNAQYGFEIKYPESWYVTRGKKTLFECVDITNYNPVPPSSGSNQITFRIIISDNQEHNSALFFAEGEKSARGNKGTINEINVNGIPAVKLSDSGDFPEVFIVDDKKTKKLYISGFVFAPNSENNLSIFNQMLSTFKFIAVDETADWKTYTNKDYGFEIKYPPFLSMAENPSAVILSNPETGVLVKFSKPDDLNYPDIFIHLRKTEMTPAEWINSTLCQPLPSGNTLCTVPKAGPISGSVQVQSQGTHFNSVDTFFSNSGILFDVSLNEKLAELIPQGQIDLYNQMLSTFRFLM